MADEVEVQKVEKIEMSERAYIVVSNIKCLDMAIYALRGMITVGIINKDELGKIIEQLYMWQEKLFHVIETNVEKNKYHFDCGECGEIFGCYSEETNCPRCTSWVVGRLQLNQK